MQPGLLDTPLSRVEIFRSALPALSGVLVMLLAMRTLILFTSRVNAPFRCWRQSVPEPPEHPE